MEFGEIIFKHSLWWIIPGLLIGGLYASLLYYKTKSPWSDTVSRLLAACRFVSVFLVFMLFMEPQIKTLKRRFEKPIALIGLDNSSSVELSPLFDRSKLNSFLTSAKSKLQEANFEVLFQTVSFETVDNPDSLVFDAPTTPLGEYLVNSKTYMEGKHHAFTILISDGINNIGRSPDYINSLVPTYTVGLGDTSRPKDIIVKPLEYNKISYQGNQFKIKANIVSTGLKGQATRVVLKKGDKVLKGKKITINKDDFLKEVTFLLTAEEEGIQKYTIEVGKIDEELTGRNNYQNAYVEVIKGKQKILLAASAPHPDIKTLRSIIEKNKNYEVSLYLNNINKFNPDEQYDLVVCHQCFINNRSPIDNILADLYKKKVPFIHILGEHFSVYKAKKYLPFLKGRASAGRTDHVSGSFNSEFSKFLFPAESQQAFEDLPPISVPYSNWTVSENTEVMLYQRVGSTVSQKPLIAFNDREDFRQAILIGSGIWLWNMHEKALEKEEIATETLFSKMVQYVSSKNDKRKLRLRTSKKEYIENERVRFVTELYNDAYERIFNVPIDISLTDNRGAKTQYNFTPTEINPSFELSDLTPGSYRFEATTSRDGKKKEKAYGQFSITEQDIEALVLQANHKSLRTIATNSGGTFHHIDNANTLLDNITAKPTASIIHSEEQFKPLINLWVILTIVGVLICIEWFFRKYLGKY